MLDIGYFRAGAGNRRLRASGRGVRRAACGVRHHVDGRREYGRRARRWMETATATGYEGGGMGPLEVVVYSTCVSCGHREMRATSTLTGEVGTGTRGMAINPRDISI